MDQPLVWVIFVVLAVLILWLWFRRGQDRHELAQLQSEHSQLRTTHASLEASHAQAAQDRDIAVANLTAKHQQYVTLESRADDLNTRLEQLTTQHRTVEDRLAERQSALDQLTARHTDAADSTSERGGRLLLSDKRLWPN